jgi:predicted metal-dependent hydrolase
LIVTVPYRFNLKEIPEILEKNRVWITRQLLKLQTQQTDELPEAVHFPATGQAWTIRYVACDSARIELMEKPNREIVLMGQVSSKIRCKRLLVRWMKLQAKSYLNTLLQTISARTQLHFESLTVRDQRTLWGSCTAKKAISLNYKLMFLPASLVEHVLIHELSHTRYLNHSLRFWNLVAAHDPQWRDHKRQLRAADDFIPGWL